MTGLVLERATVESERDVAYRIAEAVAETEKVAFQYGYPARRVLYRLATELGLREAVLHELSVREEIAG
jgi:hypothetical protein